MPASLIARELTVVRGPLVVLDAVQWADRSTLTVLDRLVRSSGHPLLVVCTVDTHDAATVDTSPVLADLRSVPASTTIAVPPFDEDEVMVILERAIGHALDEEGRRLILTLTGKPGLIPVERKCVRVPHFASSYTLHYGLEGGVHVTFESTIDPGGSIPGWMMNYGWAIWILGETGAMLRTMCARCG